MRAFHPTLSALVAAGVALAAFAAGATPPARLSETGLYADRAATVVLSGHPAGLVMPPPPVLSEGPWLVVSSATNTAHAGPWGVSFSANLTPDAETGLGSWDAKMFVETIRTGRHMGRGRRLLPPMPIPVYSQMVDADLEAIFAYLQTVPVVSNRVPAPVPPPAAAAAAH